MFTFSLLFTGYLSHTVGPLLSGATLKHECAQICVDNANCSSFFYDVHAQECYLEKYVYVAAEQLQRQSAVQYYSLLNRACPVSYIYCRFTNQCLRLHSPATMTFPAAKLLCMENLGHPAFIRSEEENEQASIVAENNTVWIGLERNDANSEWRWTDGHPLGPYINWNPTGLEDKQIFARMFSRGKWGAYSVDRKSIALCEIGVEANGEALGC